MENEYFKAAGYSQKSIYEYTNKISNQLCFEPNNDIEKIVEHFGGTVEYVDYETYKDTEDGSIEIHGENNFNIYVSQANSYAKNRFTIAHEIGHYILHSRLGKITGKAQRFPSIQHDSKIEIEANWFAASFLMPTNYFKNSYDEGLLSNAIRFGVSLETAEYRYHTFNNQNF